MIWLREDYQQVNLILIFATTYYCMRNFFRNLRLEEDLRLIIPVSKSRFIAALNQSMYKPHNFRFALFKFLPKRYTGSANENHITIKEIVPLFVKAQQACIAKGTFIELDGQLAVDFTVRVRNTIPPLIFISLFFLTALVITVNGESSLTTKLVVILLIILLTCVFIALQYDISQSSIKNMKYNLTREISNMLKDEVIIAKDV